MKMFAKSLIKALLVPVPLLGLVYVPKYIRDWFRYSRLGNQRLALREAYPCLLDSVSATPFDPHYFYQGAWLARKLCESSPARHVDVGSSVMTIAAISGFVDTVFVDFRPLQANLPNLTSRAGNITNLPFDGGSLSSISSLHVIEHIGLGRYGDELDPMGSVRAANELQRVLAAGGSLYLSTPVGNERTCFNAHRVFSPHTIVSMFSQLSLSDFAYVDDEGRLHEHASIDAVASQSYACGLFHFTKA